MNFSNKFFDELFVSKQVMAILRGFGRQRSLELSRIAWDIGVASVELPVQTAEDLEALKAVADEGRHRGFQVGAGTILDPGQVAEVKQAGAAYIVSPGCDQDVVTAALASGLPILPGVATATEIQAARRLGLSWLKAFPAAQLTPLWVQSMRGPFPDARFVVTGGVTSENASSFLSAGARVVSLGSALADPEELQRIRPLLYRS